MSAIEETTPAPLDPGTHDVPARQPPLNVVLVVDAPIPLYHLTQFQLMPQVQQLLQRPKAPEMQEILKLLQMLM